MSNAINRQEGSELIIRSREAAKRGNYAEAYRLIRDLPLTVRDLPEAVILKASLALTARRYEEALALFDEVVSVVEVCSLIHLNRIECLLGLGRLAEAEAALEDGASPLQGHYGRHMMLARIAARRGDAPLAGAHLCEACRLHPHALKCATNFRELWPHLWTMILRAWPAWKFNRKIECPN
jgi:tetratricopeptide (TPR) repeat protein